MAKFCPSMMCIDFSRLAAEVDALEKAGADMFHLDVMDGHFVPNFALGLEDIKAISKLASIPYDVHLMLSDPDPFIETFAGLGCEIIYVHAEAPVHLHRTLTNIRKAGAKAGVALNPGTPISVLEEIVDVTDVVLVMSVNPGYAGQAFIEGSVDKINRIHDLLRHKGAATQIAIDGAISSAVVKRLSEKVDYFVLGTAGLFRKDKNYKESLISLSALTV
ncbi:MULTISPECIES: ribulose-phosphate 3-epimerase [Rahnella]|uniref:ribulose-phosphate 3-epimerase n=1 Tax=Rahnella TaxID=34037 RepID=UPI001AD85758|nr:MULTISPECIES: ribulose-phosphate 3-epimerase [Rahnella]MDF1896755.1 ribulose-phosphate 3-epimerase [Rahnella contaminans]